MGPKVVLFTLSALLTIQIAQAQNKVWADWGAWSAATCNTDTTCGTCGMPSELTKRQRECFDCPTATYDAGSCTASADATDCTGRPTEAKNCGYFMCSAPCQTCGSLDPANPTCKPHVANYGAGNTFVCAFSKSSYEATYPTETLVSGYSDGPTTQSPSGLSCAAEANPNNYSGTIGK